MENSTEPINEEITNSTEVVTTATESTAASTENITNSTEITNDTNETIVIPTTAENTAVELSQTAPTPKIKQSNTTVKPTKKNKAAKLVENTKQRSRYSYTGNFSATEKNIIDIVIAERQKAGLTNTTDHFIRQCVDFTLNHSNVFESILKQLGTNYQKGFFALPNNLDSKPFEHKGFFNK